MMQRKNSVRFALLVVAIGAVLSLGGCVETAADSAVQPTGLPAAADSVLPETAAEYMKNEDVYAKLHADGSLAAAFVVNSYAVKTGGAIVDYGVYDTVENLTNLNAIGQEPDRVSFRAAAGNFYYQGDMAQAELPWQVSIAYTLDGKAITAEALAGAAGHLQIQITTSPNPVSDSVFYENYLLQVTLTLDSELCRNISAANASLADAGDQKQITFSVMPETPGDLLLSADVNDFAMEGISIAAVPFSMEIAMPDTAGITEGLDDLAGGIADLDSGAQDLSAGMRTLVTNANGLSSGSQDIMGGLTELGSNSGDLTTGSAKILSALRKIDNALDDADFSSLEDLAQLPAALDNLAGALSQMLAGLPDLQSGYSGAYAALDGAIATVSGGISEEDLAALAMANYGNSAFDTLLNDYIAAQTIKGTYQQVQPAFAAVNDNLPVLTGSLTQIRDGLAEMSWGISAALGDNDVADQLDELSDGIGELAASYKKFDQGLNEYMDGVDSLSANYATFNDGLLQYLDGVASAGSGVGQLADGTAELSTATQDMPDQVNSTVQEMMDQYDYSDFTPQSFTDVRNSHIGSVQFIMTTEEIAVAEPEIPAAPDEQKSFWQRLLDLFR